MQQMFEVRNSFHVLFYSKYRVEQSEIYIRMQDHELVVRETKVERGMNEGSKSCVK